jgi:hypothetical protein
MRAARCSMKPAGPSPKARLSAPMPMATNWLCSSPPPVPPSARPGPRSGNSRWLTAAFALSALHAPASWWFGDTTGIARRDYELGAFAWVGQADPGGQTLYACDQIPTPNNGWEGQNAMGWCNEAASTNIKLANNTLVKDERIAAYTIVQQEFTKDVPSIPLFNRTDTYAYNAKLTGIEPKPGEPYYTYNVSDWALDGSDTIIMGFTQEPASLFTLVEDAFVAQLAYTLIRPNQSTGLNYDFQAQLVKQLPTIENGGTTNNDVEVKEGDKVVDVNGDVVDLAAGVKVKNAAGEEVEFTGGTVMMKQLVSRFDIIDGLTWEDGTPVSAADLELGQEDRLRPLNPARPPSSSATRPPAPPSMALDTPRPGSPAFKTRYTSSPCGPSTLLISWVMFPPKNGRPTRSWLRPRFPTVRIRSSAGKKASRWNSPPTSSGPAA